MDNSARNNQLGRVGPQSRPTGMENFYGRGLYAGMPRLANGRYFQCYSLGDRNNVTWCLASSLLYQLASVTMLTATQWVRGIREINVMVGTVNKFFRPIDQKKCATARQLQTL